MNKIKKTIFSLLLVSPLVGQSNYNTGIDFYKKGKYQDFAYREQYKI